MSVKLLLLLLSPIAMVHAEAVPFFIGTSSAPGKQTGILRSSLDLETGKLTAPVVAADIKSPSFLVTSSDGRFLYAATEEESGGVVAFQIRSDRSLAELNSKPSSGKGTCHVWAGKAFLLTSNYSGGSVDCFPILPDGSVGDSSANRTFSGCGPNPVRQKKSYAHAALLTPDERFVYACDLGSDQVWILRFDHTFGRMEPADPPSGKVPPGGGPRHLVLGPHGDFLYVNNEMGMSVSVFKRNPETGALLLIQTIPTLPEGTSPDGSTTSGLVIHPNGRWLYVSNRGHNSITAFEIQEDGNLRTVQNVPATVRKPREFAIDPSGAWLVVGGQENGAIATMKIDPSHGTLTPADLMETNSSPVSFSFLP